MNELKIDTIKLEPAKVEFNHEQIEQELTNNLEKYQNIVFTEKNTSEIRNVLAELRKGKKAVDRYRIDTKKSLTVSIDQFEDKCKSLTKKFDETINPLNQQLQDYVQRQRDKKRKHLEGVREKLLEESGLNEKYHDQVVIEDHFLNASTSYQQSTDSMEFTVNNLLVKQEMEETNKRLIKTDVKLANAENDLSLSADAYIRLLDYNDAETVQKQIENDVKKAVSKREREAEEKRINKEKAEKFKQEKESVTGVSIEIETPAPDFPFGDMTDEEVVTESYTVTATKADHKKIEQYLNNNNLEWRLPF